MNYSRLTISKAAQLLGVSAQTLRRWDTEGILQSQRPSKSGFRYFSETDLESFAEEQQLNMEKMARTWVQSDGLWRPLNRFYCSSTNTFQLRLQSLEQRLATVKDLSQTFPLLTAIVGEIGNNSFDHNLGNWPDMPGIFFGDDVKRKKIVLADRGQGIRATLSRVRPSIQSDREALHIAFTEILTGRAPEKRGNGLKFVRKVVTQTAWKLAFQTGNAQLTLASGKNELFIETSKTSIIGCMAIIAY